MWSTFSEDLWVYYVFRGCHLCSWNFLHFKMGGFRVPSFVDKFDILIILGGVSGFRTCRPIAPLIPINILINTLRRIILFDSFNVIWLIKVIDGDIYHLIRFMVKRICLERVFISIWIVSWWCLLQNSSWICGYRIRVDSRLNRDRASGYTYWVLVR